MKHYYGLMADGTLQYLGEYAEFPDAGPEVVWVFDADALHALECDIERVKK